MLFVTKVAQKLLEKYKDVLWSDAKIPGGGGTVLPYKRLRLRGVPPYPLPPTPFDACYAGYKRLIGMCRWMGSHFYD